MNHVTTLSFTIFFLVVAVSLKDITVSALTVTTPGVIIGINGGNATFRIRYTLKSGEIFRKVLLRKVYIAVFEAPYIVPPNPPVYDGMFHGDYASRGSTDYSYGKTEFNITLSNVTLDDDDLYFVDVYIVGSSEYSISWVVVDLIPGTPSISGTPTQRVIGGAGPTVLTCTANLGKPQATLVWSRWIGNATYTYTNENIIFNAINNADGTTSGTCTLTVNLDEADDGVQFSCRVSNRQATLSAETGAIEVTAPVPVSDANIQVCMTSTTQCTSPFEYYINDQVSLTCGVNPSSPPIPAPHLYRWRQVDSRDSVISAVLSITVNESVYVCFATNTVRGVTFTASKHVTIRATAKPIIRRPAVGTYSPTPVPSLQEDSTCDANVGITISLCAVIILLLAIMLILMRRKILMLLGFGRSGICRSCAKRPARPSSLQTSEVASSAYVVTCTNKTVETEFTSAACGRPDIDVATLLESLRLRVRRPARPAVDGEQLATNSMEELSIDDLLVRLIGVPLGRNRTMLEKIEMVDTPDPDVGAQGEENEAYSELQAPVHLQPEDAAYVNVTRASVYEGLANREGYIQEEYEKLQGISVEDNESEYEIVMSPAQRR